VRLWKSTSMQTFLPYRDFAQSARVLDNKRLGKQRVEGFQIINASFRKTGGWVNHPATKMWKYHERLLLQYVQAMINEWELRGFNNTIDLSKMYPDIWENREDCGYPSWYVENYHIEKIEISHRSNLLKKDEKYYSQFNWNVPNDIAYHWPVK